MPAEPKDTGWHLDKKVQLPVVTLLLAQILGLAVWASKLESRLEDHDRRLVRAEATAEQHMARDMATEGRLSTIEAGVRSLLDTAQRLERRLDRNAER